MFPAQISLKDYDGLNGFGATSVSDVAELAKALSAGVQVSGQTGGSSLRVESLESSLKVVTFTNKHIKLWKKIPKSPAYSTVEEFNVLSAYGAEGAFGFTREGELPQTQDSTYTRQTALVKFIGTTRSVSHPMTLVNPAHGDVIALENQNGILWLLERVEDSLFHGNSGLAFDGEAEQWDGMDALIAGGNIVDMEGQPLQEADVEEASNQIIESFGYPTDMFMGTRAMSDLVKTMYPRERIQLPAPSDGRIGQAVNSMATQAGVIQFNPDVFIKQGKTPPAAATSANAPSAPATVSLSVSGTPTNADWVKLLGTTTANTEFSYAVTACNRFGESAPRLVASNLALTPANVAAGATARATVTTPAVIGANPPEFYILYRTNARAASSGVSSVLTAYSEIARFRASTQGTSATTTFDDDNLILPFTSIAYLGELTPSVLTFRQLAPLMKMDLAVLAPAYRWMVLLYGTPIMFAPAKWTRLINIGTLS